MNGDIIDVKVENKESRRRGDYMRVDESTASDDNTKRNIS